MLGVALVILGYGAAVALAASLGSMMLPVVTPLGAVLAAGAAALIVNQAGASRRLRSLEGEVGGIREALVRQESTVEALEEDLDAARASVARSTGAERELLQAAEALREQLASARAQEEQTRARLGALERELRAADSRPAALPDTEQERLRRQCAELGIVTRDAGVLALFRDLQKAARSSLSILLAGEPGTGKELFARAAHRASPRATGPFVAVNMAAIAPELFESELFGHARGGFTGAVGERRGYFEQADGGTIFLDEIGELRAEHQGKLLRVLQERTFERVGSNRSVNADVRIIAATHTNLERAIEEGSFREDLYYRLNVFPIDMPPLRERAEDLPLLVSDLISRIEHEKRGSIRLTPVALESLCAYSWPGNVRELANLMERLVILYPYGVVDVHDLPEKYQVPASLREVEAECDLGLSPVVVSSQGLPREGLNLKDHLTRLERGLIKQALDEADGVVAHAAKRLNMGRTTLVEKMKKLGIQRPDEAA
jgi:sigma-54 specific flagellar transcriptional regulator A